MSTPSEVATPAGGRPPGLRERWRWIPPELQTLGANVGWQLAERLWRLCVGLVVNVWIVRALGPAGMGLLGFAQSLVALTAILGELGLESIAIRDLVRRPREAGPLLATSAALRVGGAALSFAVALAAVTALRPGDGTARALVLVLASLTLSQAGEVVGWWFQSRARFGPLVAARSIAFTLAALAKVACLIAGAPIHVLAAAIAAEGWLTAAALLLALRREGAPPGARFDPALARGLLGDAWPLLLNSLALVVTSRADQVMIALLRGEHENGIYAAAQRLSEILWFLPVAVLAAANPGLLRDHAEDPARYRRRLGRLFRALLWTAIAAAAAASLVSGWLVRALFGPEYARSALVLAIHLWSAPALFLGIAQSNWFIAEGRQAELMARSVVGAVVNVGLNAVLIPPYGAPGAAVAVLVSQVAAHVLANAVLPHTRPLLLLQLRALLPGRLA